MQQPGTGGEGLAVFVAEVVDTGSNYVPVECGIIKVVYEYIGDIRANLISANLDSTRHKHHTMKSRPQT